MSRELLVLALACAGCAADDPLIVEKAASVGMTVSLDPGPQEAEPADATYAWDLVQAPPASEVSVMSGFPRSEVRPDLRGVYVVERWLVVGVAKELTHRYVVRVAGLAPAPVMDGPSMIAVGDTAMLSGAASGSREGRSLAYAWRLRMIPRDSAAMLATPDSVTASFVADVAGDYEVELDVFDGELWSIEPDWLVVHAVVP